MKNLPKYTQFNPVMKRKLHRYQSVCVIYAIENAISRNWDVCPQRGLVA